MRIELLVSSCALVLATMFGPAHAAVLFDDASVYVSTGAQSSGVSSAQESFGSNHNNEAFFNSPFSTGSADIAASVENGVAQATGIDHESAVGDFNNPYSGSFNLIGTTSAVVSVDSGYASASGYGSGFLYDFTVDSFSEFSLIYSEAETSSPSNAYYPSGFNLVSSTGVSYIYQESTDVSSGSVSVELDPGSYTFSAVASNDLAAQYGSGSFEGSHNDSYMFSISQAPESSTWVLMIVGLGIIGGPLRYRQSADRVLARALTTGL